MDEAELKNWLAKKLKMSDSPERVESLWRYLVDKLYVEEVVLGETQREELLEEARYQLRLASALAPATRRPIGRTRREGPIEVALTAYEKRCSEALADYLAKQASLLPEVQNFREEVLVGWELPLEKHPMEWSKEDTKLVLRELKLLLEDQLYVDFVDTRDGGGAGIDPQFQLQFLTDLEEIKELIGGMGDPIYEEETGESPIYPRVGTYTVTGLDLFVGASNYVIPYERGVMEDILDKGGKSLGMLSRRLARIYPWRAQDAAWFVLTNEPPSVLLPLTLYENQGQGTYTMTFAPWISEETFKRVYHTVQDGDNRPLKTKTLNVLRFVTYHTDSNGNRPSWSELLRLWNERCSDYPAYRFAQRDGLYRAYKRAEKELASSWLSVLE